MSWAVPSWHGFAFRGCFPRSRWFKSWCKWCRLPWQRFLLRCRVCCQRTCLLHVILTYVAYVWCSLPGFSLLPCCYNTWCRFVRPLVMSNLQHERKRFEHIWGLQAYAVILAIFLPRETNEPECSHIKHFCKTSFYQQSCTFFWCYRTSVDCWVWNGLECRVWSVKTVKTVECREGNALCRLWSGDCVKCRV